MRNGSFKALLLMHLHSCVTRWKENNHISRTKLLWNVAYSNSLCSHNQGTRHPVLLKHCTLLVTSYCIALSCLLRHSAPTPIPPSPAQTHVSRHGESLDYKSVSRLKDTAEHFSARHKTSHWNNALWLRCCFLSNIDAESHSLIVSHGSHIVSRVKNVFLYLYMRI